MKSDTRNKIKLYTKKRWSPQIKQTVHEHTRNIKRQDKGWKETKMSTEELNFFMY